MKTSRKISWQAMLDMVEEYLSWWKMKFNSRKSKVKVGEKREAGLIWKIGMETVEEEVEEFKYLGGVCVDRKLRVNVQLEKMTKEADGWMSRVNGQVEVDRERMVWELLAEPSMEYAAEVWWSGGRSTCRKLELTQMKMGKILLGQAIE